MRTIVAAIDDSVAARPVLSMSLALAPVLSAHVEAVHVAEAAGASAQAAAKAAQVPLRLLHGDPLTQIAHLAGDEDVVAAVVGAPAQLIGGRRVGNMAEALAGMISKPVVLVPPDCSPPDRVRRVLVAMKGSPTHALRLQRVIEVAAAADLELFVVHVETEETIPSFTDQIQYETEAYANGFLARYCLGAPDAQLQVRVGVPADQIFAAADDIAPDLIAVGWPVGHETGEADVAREVVARAHAPVLLAALATPEP